MENDENEGRPSVCFECGVARSVGVVLDDNAAFFLLKSFPKMFFFGVGVMLTGGDEAVGVIDAAEEGSIDSDRMLVLEPDGWRYRFS